MIAGIWDMGHFIFITLVVIATRTVIEFNSILTDE
jgi:hypothetical protein